MVLTLVGLCSFSTASWAKERSYEILFIQSYNPFAKASGDLTYGLKDGLKSRKIQAHVTVEYLDATTWNVRQEFFIMRRICQRARQRGVDVIVVSGDEAFYSLVHCGDSLGFQRPVVVAGVKYPLLEQMKHMPNVSGYTAVPDFMKVLQEAHRMFPERNEIICLTDNGFMARRGEAELRKVWGKFHIDHPDYQLTTLNVDSVLPWTLIERVCNSAHTRKTVVVVPKWTPFLNIIGKNSKAPIYACQNRALTNGVLAVYDLESYRKMVPVGHLVANILRGTSPEAFGIRNDNNFFRYDYKQLKFFSVDEKRASQGGEVTNIPLGDKYRTRFIISIVVVIGVIATLLVWQVRVNRREVKRRMEAQMRLIAQEQLVEQRDEYDHVLSSITDALITYDTGMHIRYVNRALKDLLQLPQERCQPTYYEGREVGTLFRLFIHGEDKLKDLLFQVLEGQRVVTLPERCFVQAVGRSDYFLVAGEVSPIFAGERLAGAAVTFRSIQEEEKQKSLFNMAIEENLVYPWWYDLNTDHFHFPSRLLESFGLPPSTAMLTAAELRPFIYEEDQEGLLTFFYEHMVSRKMVGHYTCRLNHAGQVEWWELRMVFQEGINPGEAYMVVGVCQCIQHFKDTEAELTEARDRAMQADHLKSAFLANMSHEIRTPLNAIVGFSTLLKDIDCFSPEEVQQFIETININCDLLLALINDVLDLSRIESGSMEFSFHQYNLSYIMQEVADTHRVNLPEGVSLRMEVPKGEGTLITTDMNRLKQVLNNLIVNAKKFTEAGIITLGYTTDDKEENVVVYVQDTGIGMSPEVQHRIFERFYKGNSFKQGAGLGLSICQTIAEALGTTIEVHSEEGKGTRMQMKMKVKDFTPPQQ